MISGNAPGPWRRLMRWALAVGVLVLGACVSAEPDPGPAEGTVTISGQLTLKGSEPGAWWAVTDDRGQVWRIVAPTPEQLPILEKAQNQRISVQGRQHEKDLGVEQIQPARIIPRPAS